MWTNSTRRPCHSWGAAAMSLSSWCSALPLYTGSSTMPVASATACAGECVRACVCACVCVCVWRGVKRVAASDVGLGSTTAAAALPGAA